MVSYVYRGHRHRLHLPLVAARGQRQRMHGPHALGDRLARDAMVYTALRGPRRVWMSSRHAPLSTAHLIAHPPASAPACAPHAARAQALRPQAVFRASGHSTRAARHMFSFIHSSAPSHRHWIALPRRRHTSVSTRRRERGDALHFRIGAQSQAGGYVSGSVGADSPPTSQTICRNRAPQRGHRLPVPECTLTSTHLLLSLQALAATAVSRAARSTRAATLAMRPPPLRPPLLRRAKPSGRRVLCSSVAAGRKRRGRGGPRQARKKEGRGGAAAIRTWCRSTALPPPRRMPGPSGSARTGTGRRSAARRPRWPPAGSCRSPRSTCPTPC